MALVVGVPTNAWRTKLSQTYGGLAAFAAASYFRVGVGGWINPGGGAVPRAPNPALTNLDVIINPGLYAPVPAIPTFQKALVPGDFGHEAPTTLRINCLLDFGEYNDMGGGASPEIWELGIFDSANVMMAYSTFAKEIKDNTKQIVNTVRIVF
jgi:hypothetical protein